MQEIVFATSDSGLSKQIASLVEDGKLRKIAPRVYTSNFGDTPESIIRRNLFYILGKLFAGAVLSHRSALEFSPTSSGQIFLTYSYTKKTKLPGITLRLMKGPGPVDGDNPISGNLYASQLERAILENLQVSRQIGHESKIVSKPKLEDRLEQVIRVKGETGLNELRDKAREIAQKLNMKAEFEKLNKMISALLSTSSSKILSSPLAIARAFGNPYDPSRILLFEKLFTGLKQKEFRDFPDKNTSLQSFKNFAFYEAYFSNYIEGTEFELEDAKKIISTEIPMLNRNEDSHDILGTYKLVSNKAEMSLTPANPDELIQVLLERHRILMSARLSKKPGEFKDKNNRSGSTYFVDHTLVKGTLIKGFDFYQALSIPFAKAAYMMFLISEVHPFLDGNGRTARIMMNAELVKHGQSKIIIPTVYRDDYMLALRRLTRQQDPSAYITMLARAHEYSSSIIGDDMDAMENKLKDSNAFKYFDEGKLKIV
jgi:Fic family protein